MSTRQCRATIGYLPSTQGGHVGAASAESVVGSRGRGKRGGRQTGNEPLADPIEMSIY